jgi:hypothetical protein
MAMFDFEMGVNGVHVVAGLNRSRLCYGCLSDDEVDAQIRLLVAARPLLKDDLKDDLTAVAMRKALPERGPLRVVSKNAARS